jgi:hypothetical protein
MQSLAIDGSNAFYAIGQVEGFTPVSRFKTTTPRLRERVVLADYLTGFDSVATDGTKLFIANGGSGAEVNTFTTFVMARNVSDNMPAPFPSGTPVVINNNGPSTYQGCIDVNVYTQPTPTDDPKTNPNRPTGLAVQKSGTVLAVAHEGLGLVRLFNKTSGAALATPTISVPSPKGVAMDSSGDLWVITGTSLKRYKTISTSPTPDQTVTGFTSPVAVAAHPTNPNIILVADGGTAQIIRAFDRTAANIINDKLWTYGLNGGYSLSNGPDVSDAKFSFQVGAREDPFFRTALAIQSDGSFWVGDGATNRLLHINSSHTASIPGDTIMFLTHNACTAVDRNNPRRVIGDSFLEFDVDYTKPIQQGWTLKKNWAAGLPLRYFGFNDGLQVVSTLPGSNERVYGTMRDFNFNPAKKIVVELPATGILRVCKDASNNDLEIPKVATAFDFYGNDPQENPSFQPDGSLWYHTFSQGPIISWFKRLVSFDASGNPRWAAPVLVASAPYSNSDPAGANEPSGNAGNNHTAITSTNLIVSFDSGTGKLGIPPPGGDNYIPSTGWHLGGISVGATQWKWKASPAVLSARPVFDGLGSFDIGDGVQYAGTIAMALGRNIIYGYNGEGWNQSEASQWMHFYDDGLFVGQFGVPGNYQHAFDEPIDGFSGNDFYPTLVGVNSANQASSTGEAYLWANDESQHSGIVRWHVLGNNTIREQSGTVSLGGTVSLSDITPPTFPSGLKAIPGNRQATLTWTAFPEAASYNVKTSATSGGPYTLAATTTNTSYTVTTHNSQLLNNGQPYYFVVSAQNSSVNSNQVQAWPFNVVGAAGRLRGGPPYRSDPPFQGIDSYPYRIDSTAVSQGLPALTGLSDVLGNLSRTSIGTNGYVIYGTPANSDTVNVRAPFTVTKTSGWINAQDLVHNRFYIDGQLGEDAGLKANPTGVITINGGGSSVHYLTVFCPSIVADPRNLTLTLRSITTPSVPPAVVSLNELQDYPNNVIVQFEFTGNVTLTMDVSPGSSGCIQAIFLD